MESYLFSRSSAISDSPLSYLEPEAIIRVIENLPVSSVLNFGATCHAFYDLTHADIVWKQIASREWGEELVCLLESLLVLPSEPSLCQWFNLYKDLTSAENAEWLPIRTTAPTPRARASNSLSLLNTNLILYGGGREGGRHLDDTWQAALTSSTESPSTWLQLSSSKPPGRFQHSSTPIGSSLLLFGGIKDNGSRCQETWLLSSPVSSSFSRWELLKPAESPAPRGAHAAAPLSGKRVVVHGGIDQDGLRLGDTWQIDLSQEPLTWQKLETGHGPEPRSGHSLTQIADNKVLLFGGRGPKLDVLGDVWILDVTELSWTRVEPPLYSPIPLNPHEYGPGPRAGHSATPLAGGRVVVVGGEDDRRTKKSDVWILNPWAGVEARCHSPPNCSPDCQRMGSLRGTGKRGRGREGTPSYGAVPAADGDMAMESPKLVRVDSGGLGMRSTPGSGSWGSTEFEEAGGGARGGEMWSEVPCRGEAPAGRSYHGACALAGGCAMFVFGGMVDGERRGHTHSASGLSFDDGFYILRMTGVALKGTTQRASHGSCMEEGGSD